MPDVLSYLCPFCDREVRVGEPCQGCLNKAGKRKLPKSWEQPESHDGLDLPDEEFDHEDFCKREFGQSPHHQTGLKWYWWALAVVVLAGMTAGALLLR